MLLLKPLQAGKLPSMNAVIARRPSLPERTAACRGGESRQRMRLWARH